MSDNLTGSGAPADEAGASDYPEHVKMAAIRDESQTIGEFLEWLKTSYVLAQWRTVDGHEEILVAEYPRTNDLLAKFFEIDLDKVEEEKRRMLETIRAVQEKARQAVPCPECAAGKHQNCDGTMWDFATDEPTQCPCAAVGHEEE